MMAAVLPYFKSGKRGYNNYLLASTVVIQLPQISYNDLFNHCAVQSEFKFKKLGQNGVYGLGSEIPNFKNKKVVKTM